LLIYLRVVEKIFGKLQTAFQCARLIKLTRRILHANQFDDRLSGARNDNLLAGLGPENEFGEIGLRVMDVDFHTTQLITP
jgi:hypothetical protein